MIGVMLALLFGLVIGIEREFWYKEAGLRTNALIALGAALFVYLSVLIGKNQAEMAVALVSGVGFLCGGVIFKEGANVKGLNTAATLWCSAAIGTISAMGFFLPALYGTLLVLLTNCVFRKLEGKIIEVWQIETTIYDFLRGKKHEDLHSTNGNVDGESVPGKGDVS